MLIIVCGSEGIHKKFLARKVIAAVNNFKVKNYSIDFNCYPFKVYDKIIILFIKIPADYHKSILIQIKYCLTKMI